MAKINFNQKQKNFSYIGIFVIECRDEVVGQGTSLDMSKIGGRKFKEWKARQTKAQMGRPQKIWAGDI